MEFVSPCGGPVGDVMNATARVESLTKYYGLLMLTTRECCGDTFRLSFLPVREASLHRVMAWDRDALLARCDDANRLNFATSVTVGGASVTSGTGSVSSFSVSGSQA
jgi:hypothetical protein